MAASSTARHDVFQAVADPTRRELIYLLAEKKELAVTQLSEPFPMTRTAISKHLKILAEAGLVKERKVGRERRYRLEQAPLNELKQWLNELDQFWDNKIAVLKHLVESEGSPKDGISHAPLRIISTDTTEQFEESDEE